MSAAHLRFCPEEGGQLVSLAASTRASVLADIYQESPTTRAYVIGNLEGELAFSVAVRPDSAAATVNRCKNELLLRLGLEGELSVEQQRLRGWIVGMLGALSDSLQGEEA
ncbi:hypothetical protein PQU95_17450 [Vogesella sp. DC21W]|uniref:Uncharacterized protein n=1 Tax=Vogesella aquatica TaxID=2984206 RepID=A0ABT5J2E7_9NEIS|nr:hypothetical protein [Vogesella aquatica]MDC7718991.1 hypothetical protein [Vogesella aquatica]